MSIDNVQDITPRIQYTATAGQTIFPYPFPIFDNTDLVVDIDSVIKTITTDYTVSGAGNDNGGNVTLTAGATANQTVTIYRDIGIARGTDFQQSGPWRSAAINDDLDKLTLIAQQIERDLSRGLRVAQNDKADFASLGIPSVANRANKYLAFDSGGLPVVSAGTGAGTGWIADIATGNTAATIKTSTVATMKALTGLADGALIQTLGHFSAGDDGAIAARYDSASSATPTATIFQPDVGGGRFFMINRQRGDSRRYGIKDDNTDQTTALQAVLNDASVQWLDLGGKTIRADSALTCTRSLVIENGTLDFSNTLTAFSALSINGSLGASTAVSGTITKGATSFVVASNALFSVGKRVLILSADAWGSSVTKGEWVTVASIAGTTITTHEPIADAYNTTITAYVPTMLAAPRLYGLKMIGSNRQTDVGQSALKLAYIDGLDLDDVFCYGWDDRGVELQRAINFSIKGVRGESMKHSGLAYAVVTGNCAQDGAIAGTRAQDVRHAVTVGGETGVDRDITITDTVGRDMRDAVIDCHPGAEGIVFKGFTHRSDGVTSGDGVVVQGLNCTLSDGVVHDSRRHGVVFQPLVTAYRSSFTCSNVIVKDANQSGAVGFNNASEVAQDIQSINYKNCIADNCTRGFMVEATAAGQDINGYSLSGCSSHRTSGDIASYVLARSGKVIRDVTITGGRYEMTATTAGKYGIYLNAAAANGVIHSTITGVNVVAGEYSIRGNNAKNNVIVANRLRGWGVGPATGITHDGTNEVIANNVSVV